MKILSGILPTSFERGMLAGACLVIAVAAPLIASKYQDIANGKWVITGLCSFVFLVLLFAHSWAEAKKQAKQTMPKGLI